MQAQREQDMRRLEAELARCCGRFPEVLDLRVGDRVPMEMQAQLPFLDFNSSTMAGNPLMGKFVYMTAIFRHPHQMTGRISFDLAGVTAYPRTAFTGKVTVLEGGAPLETDVESGHAGLETQFTSAVAVAAVMEALATRNLVLLAAMLRRALVALAHTPDGHPAECSQKMMWLLCDTGVWVERELAGGPTHNSLDYLKSLGDFLTSKELLDSAVTTYRQRVKDLFHSSVMDPAKHPLDATLRRRVEAWEDLAVAYYYARNMPEATKSHKAALREADKGPRTMESSQLRVRICIALASIPWDGAKQFVNRAVEEAVLAVCDAAPDANFASGGKLRGGSPPLGHPLLKRSETIVVEDLSGKQYAYNFRCPLAMQAISVVPEQHRINFGGEPRQPQLPPDAVPGAFGGSAPAAFGGGKTSGRNSGMDGNNHHKASPLVQMRQQKQAVQEQLQLLKLQQQIEIQKQKQIKQKQIKQKQQAAADANGDRVPQDENKVAGKNNKKKKSRSKK